VRVAGNEMALVEKSAGGDKRDLHLAPAQFEWRAEAAAVTLENTGSSTAELYEFEMK
jgi:hypothetical protein